MNNADDDPAEAHEELSRPLSPRAALTRQTILEAARTCFAKDGLAATSTRTIASAAGVTQPLIHHYFGSKESLFEAVLDATAGDYEASQASQFALPSGDLRFFTSGLPVLFRWLGANQETLRLSAWARLQGYAVNTSNMRRVIEIVRARLVEAQGAGLLRSDVDIDATMVMIDAMLKGYWDRRESLGYYSVDPDVLDERYLRQSLQTLLRGLLTEDAAARALATLAS